MLESAVYFGQLQHRRLMPKPHGFKYAMAMVLLELDELDNLFSQLKYCDNVKASALRFMQNKYLRAYEGDSLKQRFTDAAKDKLSLTGQERVFVLTQLRHLGVAFNPVSFYFIIKPDNTIAMLAEVTNTPWHQTHCYFLDSPITKGNYRSFRFEKKLHVSPFLEMDYNYHLKTAIHPDRLMVHMENWRSDEKHFTASLALTKAPWEQASINKILLRYPFSPWKVIVGIYWQALKIYLKGNPFYSHP